jgi:hypothetical protein
VEFGDWQTPPALAAEVVTALRAQGFQPAAVIEPTCGLGTFLAAARTAWPKAQLSGFEVNPAHVEQARAALGEGACVELSDFFTAAWEKRLRAPAGLVLILGNPPWVTSSELGALGAANLPQKANWKGFRGLDAITGRSNFDVSEWMLLRLLSAAEGTDFVIAMLCKAAVARRLLEHCARHRLPVAGEFRGFDAKEHFGAAVEAVLLVLRPGSPNQGRPEWPVFASILATEPASRIGVADGVLCSDVAAYHQTRGLGGNCDPEWRSGLKHDCSRVMEFSRSTAGLTNGDGEAVDLEDTFVYPLLKGSDLANGRLVPTRAVLVPQCRLGQETGSIRESAPRTWAYLSAHRAALDARKSSIYAGQPPFAVFGVGEYTFAPWKVGICGLYKRLDFAVVGPSEGRAVVLDDTCYFLPFASEGEARTAAEALASAPARKFLTARIFWDAKRPVNKEVLQSLDIAKLLDELGLRRGPAWPRTPQQQPLAFHPEP